MAYAAEWDDIRQELRASLAGTVIFWAKVDGTGNTTASSVAGDCTFEVFDCVGTSIQAVANITPTAVTGVGSRFDCAVSAISTIAEDYRLDLIWKVSGGAKVLDRIYFDVVAEPWGRSTVSLNSIISLCPDLQDRITRQGARLSQTAEQRASTLGHLARVELSEMLRAQVLEDVPRLTPVMSATSLGRLTPDGYLRPRLIKDRARLHAVETKLAIAICLRGDLRADVDEGDGVHALYSAWMEQALASFKSMGPLRYDIDDSGTVDTKIKDVGRYYVQTRAQS